MGHRWVPSTKSHPLSASVSLHCLLPWVVPGSDEQRPCGLHRPPVWRGYCCPSPKPPRGPPIHPAVSYHQR